MDHPVPLPPGTRRVSDDDADALITVIAGAYAEHPGCVLDLPGVDDDLPAPATTAARRGSPWWVVERDGQLVASIAAGPVEDDGTIELKRLYLAPAVRGQGLATQLVGVLEAHAAGLGATVVVLWSDTRFAAAHRRYEALGYTQTGATRELHDPSNTTEYRFERPVTPSPPGTVVSWNGPAGQELASLTPLPDGWCLAADLPDRGVAIRVEVDDAWRTRRADVRADGVTRRVTSDGAGRWWLDGRPAPHLAGAADVDVEVSPLTNTLPIRRLLAAGEKAADVRAAWVRVPGEAVEVLEQRYEHLGRRRWRYTSGEFEAELTVDDDGLVERYGEHWDRA